MFPLVLRVHVLTWFYNSHPLMFWAITLEFTIIEMWLNWRWKVLNWIWTPDYTIYALTWYNHRVTFHLLLVFVYINITIDNCWRIFVVTGLLNIIQFVLHHVTVLWNTIENNLPIWYRYASATSHSLPSIANLRPVILFFILHIPPRLSSVSSVKIHSTWRSP